MPAGELGEIMWPSLVANKILRKRYGSNNFIADFPSDKSAPAGGDDSVSPEISSFAPSPPQSSFNSNALYAGGDSKDGTLNYKVFVSTWNVGGIAPGEDLELNDLIDPCNPCDIYVFGFQEMVPLSASNVLGSENVKLCMKWNSLIREGLNRKLVTSNSEARGNIIINYGMEEEEEEEKLGSHEEKRLMRNYYYYYNSQKVSRGFRCIISKQMVGIQISVWVGTDLCGYVRNPSVSCIGCGIMGCLGNKGSVSVRFQLHETSFCFVCCHLASGGREGDEKIRNDNVSQILSRTTFPRGPSLDLPHKILDHDRVVFLGDLNYRISLPEQATRSLVDSTDWKSLLQNDQLSKELEDGQHFGAGWHEGKITFAPTYKYRPNSDVYCGCVNGKKGEKRRAPAWCDRVIWHGLGLRQQVYTRSESKLSDHRPVKAIFSARVNLSKTTTFHRLFLSDRFDRITTQRLQVPASSNECL